MEHSDFETAAVASASGQRLKDDVSKTSSFCIAGMHRSGTSLVAGLLHACGVFVGPEHELTQPATDNQAGHFENLDFVKLNDDIISHFGGRWNDPPVFPPGWELSADLDPFVARAQELIARSSRQHWGWKDPRNSLTLPFWRRIIPDVKVVVCLRNPLEVTRSLFVRGDVDSPSQFKLWLTYNRRLLSSVRSEDRLITHYRSYFLNPREELNRILEWLNVSVSKEAIESACAQVSAKLRHHAIRIEELIEADVPDEVLGLYFSLCANAGPIYQQLRKQEIAGETGDPTARTNELNALINELQRLRATHDAREQIYEAREQTLTELLNSKTFKLASFYWRLRRK